MLSVADQALQMRYILRVQKRSTQHGYAKTCEKSFDKIG